MDGAVAAAALEAGPSRRRHAGLWIPLLTGTGLWTWLLVFPFFGPLLAPALGGAAAAAGYVFAAFHALGLLLLADPRRRQRLAAVFYPALPVLTVMAFLNPPPLAALALMAAMGVGAAGAVLRWVEAATGSGRPGLVLAGAAGGANLVLWLFSLPSEAPAALRLPGEVVVLAAALTLWLAQPRPAEEHAGEGGGRGGLAAWAPPWPLLAFALAAYSAGGVMYGALAPAVAAHPLAEWLGVWPYILALAPAAAAVRAPSVGRLLPWTLSILGVGYAVLTAARGVPWLFVLAWCLVMAGLGTADAYYWRTVMQLLASRGARPAALALSWNVVVVAGTSVVTGASGAITAAVRLPLAGAAVAVLLFILAPLLTAEAHPSPPPASPGRPLTRAEQQVLDLLLQGMTDAEVADALVISRNTVKYHVRNVLRKTGHRNRRELRSSFATSTGRPRS